jgi:hypothetical protein
VSTRRPLFVHAGCSKTGTSALQAGLWRSVDPLAAAGVGLPYVGRPEHVRGLLRPFGWAAVSGFAGPWDEAVLEQAADRMAATPGDRLLVSNEDLAEVGSDEAARIGAIADRAGLDLHLVVTLRSWGQQLPSEYQQFLKHSMPETYLDFLVSVRDATGPWGTHYRRRQDAVDILRRWGVAVAPENVHLIVVPSYTADPDGVFRLMGEAVGFPGDAVARPGRAVNASYGVVEAEVFRRVNAAVGAPLAGYSADYQRYVRGPLVRGVLATQASPRLTLPPEHAGWVTDHARATVAALTDGGYVVHGDLDRLVPAESDIAPLPPVDDAEVAAAAIGALARYADFRRRSELRLQQRLTEQR